MVCTAVATKILVFRLQTLAATDRCDVGRVERPSRWVWTLRVAVTVLFCIFDSSAVSHYVQRVCRIHIGHAVTLAYVFLPIVFQAGDFCCSRQQGRRKVKWHPRRVLKLAPLSKKCDFLKFIWWKKQKSYKYRVILIFAKKKLPKPNLSGPIPTNRIS